MAGWVDVNDSGQAHATAGNTIGGITFGSAGSGRHTTDGAALPPWLIAVGLVAVALVVIGRSKRK